MNCKNATLLKTLLVSALVLISTGLFALNITWTGDGDGTSWHDADNWDTGTIPTSEDFVDIRGTAMVIINSPAEAYTLLMEDDAVLTISNTGQLSFNGNSGQAIVAFDNTQINNNGTLAISLTGSDGISLVDLASLVNHNILTILSSEGDGIDMVGQSTFTNYGNTTITGAEEEGIDMEEGSKCFNHGFIHFELMNDFDPVDMNDGGTRFENYGTIEIVNIINGGEGIEVAAGIFTNKATGSITMATVTGDALRVQEDGTFINEGYIGISFNPIEEEEVEGEEEDNNGIEIECGGVLRNEGIIEITNNGPTDAIELECDAELVNESCGEIYILTNNKIDIESTGTFTNYGILSTIFNGVNTNNGTFINGGQIIAPSGFQLAPNAVMDGSTLPEGWQSSDIGNSGSLGNNFGFLGCEEEAEFVVAGGGNNATSTTSDNVAFAYQTLCGNNITITAKIENVTPNGYGGLMIREIGGADSKQVSIFSNQSSSLRHETRYLTGANKVVQNFVKPSPIWLRLQRQGNWVFAYSSSNGVSFQYVHAVYIPLSNCIEIGLASFTYLPNSQTEATFSHVEITGGVMMPYVETPAITEATTIKQAPALYPNPAKNMVNLVFENGLSKDAIITLRNQLGQVIEQRELQAGDFATEWNVNALIDGLYFFEIWQDGKERQVLQFVKTK